jgi:transcription antitermination factor NusG
MPIEPKSSVYDTSAGAEVNWHALYTRHQHEKTVAQILSGKGFETFLPLYSSANRWKDRTKLVCLPLFPCYVFLKANAGRTLNILTTPGVHSIVSVAGTPVTIPEKEIDDLRLAVGSGAPLQPHPLLKIGDRVRVKAGPLAGVEGVLVRHKNVCRVVLTLEMLGKAAAVEVDALVIERVRAVIEKQSMYCSKPSASRDRHDDRFDTAIRWAAE